MNQNKSKKLKHILAYTGTFIGVFAISAVTAFFVAPTSVKSASPTNSGTSTPTPDTPVVELTPPEKFVASLAANAPSGLEGTINASFAIPQEGKSDVTVKLNNAKLQFSMPSLSDIQFSLSAAVVYGAKTRTLDVIYTGSDAYISLSNPSDNSWDMKYSLDLSTTTTYDENGDQHDTKMKDIVTIGQYIVNMVGDSFDFSSIGTSLTSATSSIDTDALMSALGNMESVEQSGGGYKYYLSLPLGSLTLPIEMESDKDFNLTGVALPGTKTSTTSDTVALDNGMKFNAFVTCDYKTLSIAKPENAASYHPLVNSLDLVGKVYNLVKTPKFGVSLDSTISHVIEGTTKESADINLAANVDVTDTKNPTVSADLAFVNGEKSQTIDIAYLNSMAYVSYASALKAKMSKTTFDSLVGKLNTSAVAGSDDAQTSASIEKVLSLISGVKLYNTLKSVKDGVTSVKGCTLLTGIKDGVYDSALDFVTSMSFVDNKITLVLNLTPLSLSGTITVVADATSDDATLLSIQLSNIGFASFTYSGTLAITSYTAKTVEANQYQELTHLPDIFDQASSIIKAKKGGFSVSGSVMTTGDATTGFTLNGSAQLNVDPEAGDDYKSGSGTITITDKKTGKADQDYKVNIDVVNTSSMYFTYNSGSTTNTLKGKFTIDTLNDIISLVKTLIGSKDKRFTKYSSLITSSVASTVVGDIIDNKLNTLIDNNILIASSFGTDSASFTISKSLMGSDSDIVLTLNYKDSKTLKSLSVNMGMSGKTIDLTVGIDEAAAKMPQHVSNADRSNSMDFSQIAVLLKYLGNTALLGTSSTNEVSTYHIEAKASATLGVLNIDAVTIDMRIYLDGAHVKIYGYVKLPMVTSVDTNGKGNHLGGTRTTMFAYETTEDDPDGEVYLRRYDDNIWYIWDSGSWDSYTMYRKVDGKEFMNNIKGWLLGFMLGINDSIFDSSSSSSSDSPIYVEDGFKSFTYTDGTNPSWDVNLDLGALTNVSALKDLNLTISGTSSDTALLNKMSVELVVQEIVKIDLKLDAKLTNVSDSGVYTECWDGSTYSVTSKENATFDQYVAKFASLSESTNFSASSGE